MRPEALGDLSRGIVFEHEAADLALGACALVLLVFAGLLVFAVLAPLPLEAPVESVQSHIAVRRASASKPVVSAPVKIIVRASLATAAQTCSRYSLSVTASPLAFSTRE